PVQRGQGRSDADAAHRAQQPRRHHQGPRRQVHRPRVGLRSVSGMRRFLTGRVARQVFLLFVLSAFVPFALIATLSYVQVRQLHAQNAQQRLAVASKQYGMGVYERLLLASEVARHATDFRERPWHGKALAETRFRALGFIDARGRTTSLLGSIAAPAIDESARERLAEGKPLVRILPREGDARVLLLLPAEAGAVLVGEVDPEYLWGDSDQLPAATEVCVIGEAVRSVLHCSAPMPTDVLVGILKAPSEYAFKPFGWKAEGKE